MPRRFKVMSVNRINNLLLSVPVMQQKHFNSHPDQTGDPQSRIVNDRKRKLSHIHVLCNVLFCLPSKNLSDVCTGLHSFLSNAIRVTTSSRKQNLTMLNRMKMTQRHFSVQWTQKRVQKPLKRLIGVAKLQSKKS